MRTTIDGKLISVIVPVFNCKKTVSKCLTSILSQTYQNIEVIVVDDGSDDGSEKVCEIISQTDSRIKLIHKKNQGVSIARNIGLTYSSGQYVCFVDSDDWLPPQAIELLYNQINRYNADICVGKVLSIESGRNYILKELTSNVFDLNDEKEMFRFTEIVDWAPWAKLYKKSLIELHQCKFEKNIKSCEDSIFVADYLSNCKKATSVDVTVYYYNNLNAVTASRKYYKLYKNWSFLFADKYASLFERFRTDYARCIINRKYILRCYETCLYYSNQNIDDTTKYRDILETLNLFRAKCNFAYEWPVDSSFELKKNECVKHIYLLSEEKLKDMVYTFGAHKKNKIKDALKVVVRAYKILKYFGVN